MHEHIPVSGFLLQIDLIKQSEALCEQPQGVWIVLFVKENQSTSIGLQF